MGNQQNSTDNPNVKAILSVLNSRRNLDVAVASSSRADVDIIIQPKDKDNRMAIGDLEGALTKLAGSGAKVERLASQRRGHNHRLVANYEIKYGDAKAFVIYQEGGNEPTMYAKLSDGTVMIP